tara:strand:+ start:2242 stop:2535 length:294 start_codon:yes stop_codon:yes gene_type:complete
MKGLMVLRCVSYLAVIHLIVSVGNLVRGCKRAPERVTFTNLGVPAVYSSAIIYKECAEQVFANAPMSGIGYKMKPNFKVDMIDKKIKRDLRLRHIDK